MMYGIMEYPSCQLQFLRINTHLKACKMAREYTKKIRVTRGIFHIPLFNLEFTSLHNTRLYFYPSEKKLNIKKSMTTVILGL